MAEEGQEEDQSQVKKQPEISEKIVKVAADGTLAALLSEEQLVCIALISQRCQYSIGAALPAINEQANLPENEKLKIALVDVDVCPQVAVDLKASALPAFYFFNGLAPFEVGSSFSGNNMDKFRLMVKACILKRQVWLAEREKQREEEAKAAAIEAAREAASNQTSATPT
jgi:hypothetical protein